MITERSIHKALLATLLLALGSTTALADEEHGLYIGGGLGQFGLSFNASDIDLGELDFDDEDTAVKVFAGWRLNKNFALELDYMDLGKPSENISTEDVGIGVQGFAPYLVGTLPLGLFELSARVGYLFYDIKLDTSDFNASDSDQAFAYGVGAGIVLFNKLPVRLEWERFEISDVDKAEAWWVTAAWRF